MDYRCLCRRFCPRTKLKNISQIFFGACLSAGFILLFLLYFFGGVAERLKAAISSLFKKIIKNKKQSRA